MAIIWLIPYLGSCTKDKIVNGLPKEAEILKLYKTGGIGNGDFTYALKSRMPLESYLKYVRSIGLTDSDRDPTSVIGFNVAQNDVPEDIKDIWDEPVNPDKKFYAMHKRDFIRATYSNGCMYYYSRGW